MKIYASMAGLLGLFSWWNFGSTEDSPPPEVEEVVAPSLPILEDYHPAAYPFIHADYDLPLKDQQASTCGACHSDIYEQWYKSPHRTGLLSENLLTEWAAHNNAPSCQNCHLPLVAQQPFISPTFVNGDPTQPIQETNPSFEASLYPESVGCVACHMRDGKIVGQKAIEAPHSLIHSPELEQSSACQSCHQGQPAGYSEPIYTTMQEWQSSSFAKAGVQCQDCHMAAAPTTNSLVGAITQSSHLQSLNPRQALTVELDYAPTQIQRGILETYQVTIVNSGAGHSIPTGSPFQPVELKFQVVQGEADLQKPISHTLGLSFSDVSPKKIVGDSRIPADGVLSFQVPVEVGQKKQPGRALFIISYIERGESVSLLEYPIEIR